MCDKEGKMFLKFLKIIRLLHLIDKETYNRRRFLYLIEKSKYFDEAFYRKEHKKVDFTKVSPAEHYLTIGYKKGYNPSRYFSTNGYFEENPDVKEKGINPLVHYELCGKKEGRKIGAADECMYSLSLWKKVCFSVSTFIGRMIYKTEIRQNQHARILVCLHLYYMSAWQVIQKYLKNLSPYQYDLIVTYIDEHHDKEILKKIKNFKPNTTFYAYPNRGFDVGPFVDVLQKVDLDAYDIVFKIHSKGIKRRFRFIYNQVFKYDDWFYNLMNSILGGINCHKAISILMNNPKVGVVAAQNLIIEDPLHKQELTQAIASELNISLPQPYHYVAGTMFALKSASLKSFKSLNLNIKKFTETQRGTFTLAHAIERIICAMVENNKYKILGLYTPHKHYLIDKYKSQKTSSLRLLADNRFDLDADFFYKTLETRKVKTYCIHKIRIGDINRKWIDGNLYKLKDCSPFMYLSGDKERYKNYCKINNETSKFEISEDKFNHLIASMDKGYNPKQMPVIHSTENILMDGQHRLCYLLNKYGEDYEVECLHLNHTEKPITRSQNV